MDRPDRDREARVVLIDYHAVDLMPAADKDAAWVRLQSAIAAGDPPITDVAPEPPRPRAWLIAALIAAAILLAIAGLGTLARPHSVAAVPQEAVHDAPTVPQRPTERLPPTRQPVPEAISSEPPQPPPQRPRPRPADADLDAELALLRAAREALTAGDFSEALARLDEHTRRWPRGHLAEERARLRVQALCSAGARAEARAAAEAFARANPASPHTPKLLRTCTE